jgi:hypothetical protein
MHGSLGALLHHSKSGLAFPELAPQGGEAPASHDIKLTMQKQKEDFWCWAATAVSLARHYDCTSTWTQCKLASIIKDKHCCLDPGPCNESSDLDTPLQVAGCFGGREDRPVSLSEIRNRIWNSRKAICIRIAWDNQGNGHFLAIGGYSIADEKLIVCDPATGTNYSIPYQDILTDFQGQPGAVWSHSYYT